MECSRTFCAKPLKFTVYFNGAKAMRCAQRVARSNLWRVSERLCKQVSVSLPKMGDSHDDQYDDYTGATGSTAC